MHRRATTTRPVSAHRRGSALVAVLVLVFIAGMVITGFVATTGRDADLTASRVQTIQAFYAAESGINMALREIARNADEDGDGSIGTISDDDNAANDPAVDDGFVVVTQTIEGGITTITSRGRCGESFRQIEVDIEN